MPASIITAHGQSHTGNVRSDNQDAIQLVEPPDEMVFQQYGALYGVADGMGGYEHGGVASALALETFVRTFYSSGSGKPQQNLRRSIQDANLAVYQAAQKLGARMGTTLSIINLVGQQLHIAHIGDSRVYLVRDRKARCLTNDHTAVGDLVRMRILSPDKVRTHERRSILQKALGVSLFVQSDITSCPIQKDDFLILCSDGVWAYVEDDEFAEVVQAAHHPERISQMLIEHALERESDDNLSALVVHVARLTAAAAVAGSGRLKFAQFLRERLTGKT
jgi:PPM family protein phosphatase